MYLLDAISEVRDVVERADGSVDWLVTVRADDLVPLLNSGGAATRLAGVGADQSGIETELTLHQGADGYLTGATGDFDEWWSHAISLTEFVATTSETMHLELRLEPYEAPLILSSPCEGREIVTGDDMGVPGQACEA